MSSPVKVGGYLLALVVVLAATIGAGRALGPLGKPVAEHAGGPANHAGDPTDHADGAEEPGHGNHDEQAGARSAADVPGGLMVSQGGYTLALEQGVLPAGQDVEVRFAITGPDGRPVTRFDVEHDKRLHLIAVRRDHTGFQHVHPGLGPDGSWTARLDLAPGPWRLFADFRATGAEALTLGADLLVPGPFAPARPATPTRVATVGGYTVRLAGDLQPRRDSRLTLTVTKGGAPVTDLEPYLGAYGHLVALREGDLAYLHVHPEGTPGDDATAPGPDVVFFATVPTAGRYRLYLDFQHQGVVRTAAFTVATPGAGSPSAGATTGHGNHGH